MSKNLPIVPMRSAVLFPGVSLPVTAARPPTLRAIEAELRYAPHCYADRRQALQDAVASQLRADNPELDQALRSGELVLSLRFLAPGKLGAATTFKI